MTLPVLSLLIVMPFAGALVAGLMKDPAMSRRVGVSVALGTLFLALGIVSNFDPSVRGPQILELALDLGPAGSRPLLAMDALSAPLLPLTALLTLGVVVAAPRSQVNQDGIAAVLSMTGATLGLMLSRNIGLLAIFWLGTLLPGMVRVARLPDPHARIPLSRSFGVFLFGTSAPLMGVVWWLGELAWRSRLSAPLDLDEIATLQLPIGSQWLVLVLLMFAVAVRKGVFPFHSWLPLFAER
ncbi:MAG: hypothetical protein IT378_12925, partial [Sandaracinaceae bacterium]|nr:hypothetical protein [Sandaracinaceae bacterium]